MNSADLREECRALLAALEREPAHVLHVTWLALQFFDQLEPLHGLSVEDRLLLEAAACLHDVGWNTAPGGKEHHKESARLIRGLAWRSLAPEEIEVVAQVARYHRRAMPALAHEEFAALTARDRRRVQLLAAMLRLADALDRRHERRVSDVTCAFLPHELEITLHAPLNVDAEIRAAQRKGDLAALVFQRELYFRRDGRD
jgi:exopolyphosphatase/guanosine-5'-triphosphate,3'-diphosphate pyrophosphatase